MENKTGKYLKYAIGEIALVVIGILIALQINNWNSNRVAKQVELNQIDLLIEDARADSVFFGTRAEFLSNVVSLHESILNMYESTLIDSISKLKKKENTFIFGMRLANQSNVVVNNTNSLDIIKDDSIIKYLKKYYAKYEYVKVAIDLSNRMLEEHAIPLYLKYPDELKASNSDSTLASYRHLIMYKDILPNIELSQNFQQNSLNQVSQFNDLNALFIQKLEAYLKQ